MAGIKAVAESNPDPKLGVPRRMSAIAFPYYNLATSIVVAKTMHEKAGGECDRIQLAGLLGYKGIKNGSFLTRVTSAKMFGLISQDGDKLKVTPRGQAILSPVTAGDADRAKVEAFLAVPLFGKVFEEFKGQALPAEVGLRHLLENKYKVVKDRVGPTVNIMLDSAEEAGFFRTLGNRSQMITPLPLSGSPNKPAPTGHAAAAVPAEPSKGGGGAGHQHGGGGGDGLDHVHPMIAGFLKTLPPPGTMLTAKRMTALIEAFKATLGVVYPDSEDQTSNVAIGGANVA